MQRSLNFTKRRRILQEEATFGLQENGGDTSFNVELKLKTEPYPDDARIYIDAYYRETRQRYDYGTVGNIHPPQSTAINEVDLSGRTQFSVLVVDESGKHGRLLGLGDRFTVKGDDDQENRSSIMTVVARPLGQKPWEVQFLPDGTPELALNKAIPDAIERLRNDPLFQGLILPAALRSVLVHYLWNDNDEDDENNESCSRWMAFAALMADEKPETDDTEILGRWVDEVVAGFCNRSNLNDHLVDVLARSE